MYFLYVFVVFFVIIGIISVVRGVATAFLRIDDTCCSTNLLMIINNCEQNDIDLETKIALTRLKWYNNKKYDNIYIVGCGLSEETFKLCEEHCRTTDAKLLSFGEFAKIIYDLGRAYD